MFLCRSWFGTSPLRPDYPQRCRGGRPQRYQPQCKAVKPPWAPRKPVPGRVIHACLKATTWAALRDEIRRHGSPREASPDDITVEIDDDADYEPDAVVTCGPPLPADAIAATNPVIVVVVPSPGTRQVDTGAKLVDYFRLPTVQHCLVVRPAPPAAIHHLRQADGTILTRIASTGASTAIRPAWCWIWRGARSARRLKPRA